MLVEDIKDPKHRELLNEMLKKMNEAIKIFDQNKLELKRYILDLYNSQESQDKKHTIGVSYVEIKNNIFSDSNFIEDFDDGTLMKSIEEYIVELGFVVNLVDGEYRIYRFDNENFHNKYGDKIIKSLLLFFGLFPSIVIAFIIIK